MKERKQDREKGVDTESWAISQPLERYIQFVLPFRVTRRSYWLGGERVTVVRLAVSKDRVTLGRFFSTVGRWSVLAANSRYLVVWEE